MKKTFTTYAVILLFALTGQPGAAVADYPREINALIAELFASNPDILAAERDLALRLTQNKEAKAGFFPTAVLSGSAYYARNSQNAGSPSGSLSNQAALDVEQPVFRGWRTTAEAARTRRLVDAEEKKLRATKTDIVLDALVALADADRDSILLDLRLKNEKTLEDECRAAEERFALGEITQTDVVQAKSRLARAQSERVQAHSALQSSLARFEAVTGRQMPETPPFPEMHFAFPDSLPAAILQADASNPAIETKSLERAAAEDDIATARSALYPQLSAFANYTYEHDALSTPADASGTGSLGLRATYTLYQGGADHARISASRAAESRKRQEIVKIKRAIREQTISRFENYHAANAQLILRTTQVQAAEAALAGVREESRMGERSVLDVLDASQEVFDAQASLAAARRNQAVASLSLAASLDILLPP
jgi:TolC family type I secretion outer membrane protein